MASALYSYIFCILEDGMQKLAKVRNQQNSCQIFTERMLSTYNEKYLLYYVKKREKDLGFFRNKKLPQIKSKLTLAKQQTKAAH